MIRKSMIRKSTLRKSTLRNSMIDKSMIDKSTIDESLIGRRVRSKRTRAQRILAVVASGALVVAVACGGTASSSKQNTTTPATTSGNNVLPITVNAGPAGNYVDGAFTSVTVCAPGTSTCQTIDGVLVDTGSSGLRILSSALTTALPQQKTSDGNAVVECLPFVSSFTWGPVQTADIELAGEKASSLPIQVISQSDFPIPEACSNMGQSQNTLSDLGANGILGVSVFAQDCGGGCVSTGPSNPSLYYECPVSGSCTVTGEPLSQQVANPVAFFPTDNNGVIVELPSVTTPQASLNGSLVFGIGTQSNNGLGSAQVYGVDGDGDFITIYKSQTYNNSFIDSGSNGYYFLDSSTTGIPTCSDSSSFYCPPSTENLSATTAGASGTPATTVNFSVANADSLFNSNPNATVFADLAGPNSGSNSLSGFDWGLPFFYGRNVFTAIEGKSTPGGTGPYWAY
jgi:Protein of unknown function (DUF3443)